MKIRLSGFPVPFSSVTWFLFVSLRKRLRKTLIRKDLFGLVYHDRRKPKTTSVTQRIENSINWGERQCHRGQNGVLLQGQTWGRSRLILKKNPEKDVVVASVKEAICHRPDWFSWPKRRYEQRGIESFSHSCARNSHAHIGLLWPFLYSGTNRKRESAWVNAWNTDRLTDSGILYSSPIFLVRLIGCPSLGSSPL